ncbi:MAG TPA: hypothetical protein VMU92_04440 [Acidobacteriaceae bacterium]|nr:hypothetical protein [Acidobacteriaceae bacterium]
MNNIIRSAIFATAAICATAAFAADRAEVNIPFSFVSQGKSFPAGRYSATLDANHNVLELSNVKDASYSAHWTANPADFHARNEKLTLKFDDLGHSHHLRTMQLGPRITSRLDAPVSRLNAGSIVASASGQ